MVPRSGHEIMARLGGGVGPYRHTRNAKRPEGDPERHSRLVVDPDRVNSITYSGGNPFLADLHPHTRRFRLGGGMRIWVGIGFDWWHDLGADRSLRVRPLVGRSFKMMLREGLGSTLAMLVRICKEDKAALEAIDRVTQRGHDKMGRG